MRSDPIDYDGFLGISKKEWTRVLGVNLALVLTVYVIAMICTLCGNGFFVLNFHSDALQNIEDTLRGWGLFAFVQLAFAAIEVTLLSAFIAGRLLRFWIPIAIYASLIVGDLACWGIVGTYPSAIQFAIEILAMALIAFFYNRRSKRELLFGFVRFAIALAISFALNGLISLFRTGAAKLWDGKLSNSFLFALNFEYYIALVLLLLFLWLVLPFGQRKGDGQCPTETDASGSSPTMRKWSPKNSQNAKKTTLSDVPPQTKKRLRVLKAKVIAIQTTALIVIAFLPWAVGKPVEFSLVYASFCLTRSTLGFSHSLHFKSELVCVTAGALVFWLLTYLTPNVETCLILALVYGGFTAIAFRLYWELRDLMLYKKSAKLDRYAMFTAAFKGNVDPKHIKGIMRMRGYDKDDISIVQAYMRNDKVDAIAIENNYSKRTIETRLTELATELYAVR